MSKVEISRCPSRSKPRLSLAAGMLAAVAALAAVKPMSAQTHDQAAVERRVVTRVDPEYPLTLKRLYIGGVVRVETVVAANGTVVSAQLMGGNPILGQSAMKAIKQWKYAPAKAKEEFVVQLEFDPHR